MSGVVPHRTAMKRLSLSRPTALLLEDGLISKNGTFFDYGCGRGGDLLHLHKLGFSVSGWDPAFFPDEERVPADVVNLGYVVNVIEDPVERTIVLGAAWDLTKRVLVVSARLEWDARNLTGNFRGDGIVTRKSTFQKFYTQEELRGWIDSTLSVQSVAAAPGVFYVFRDPSDEQAFTSSRLRRRTSVPRVHLSEEMFQRHERLLAPVMEFAAERGRLPFHAEVDGLAEVNRIFGSCSNAFSLIRRVTGPEKWERIRREREQDLLVYVALSAFGKRPRFGKLPETLRGDIRAFFGSYRAACSEADRLLFSAGDIRKINEACDSASVGKVLPDALYVHPSALESLPPLLRVYEGCGRQLVGAVEGMSLIKLFRRKARVSYLVYADFDRTAHPGLSESFAADLPRLMIHHRDYRDSDNPPILHRKELFVSHDYPHREKFARLTAQEVRLGLLGGTNDIGNRDGWLRRLAEQNMKLSGHRVMQR